MISHVLRNFLYLDTQLVDDYLSSIEGFLYDSETVVEKEIDGRTFDTKNKSGQQSDKNESILGLEVTKKLRLTDSSKFQRLYKLLKNEDAFSYWETVTAQQWDNLKRNDLLEGIVTVRFSNMDGISAWAGRMNQLAGFMESVTGESLLEGEFTEAMKGLNGLGQLQQGKGIPCVMSCIDSDYKFVAYLNPQFLKVSKENMIGELTIFCKVQRKLRNDEKIDLNEIFPSIQNSNLSSIFKEFSGDIDIVPPELEDTVNGPAAVIIPIAIYR